MEIWTSRKVDKRKDRKIRGAFVLIKNKGFQCIIKRLINKLHKLEGSETKATVKLKFIDKNEIKKVSSAKLPLFEECKV